MGNKTSNSADNEYTISEVEVEVDTTSDQPPTRILEYPELPELPTDQNETMIMPRPPAKVESARRIYPEVKVKISADKMLATVIDYDSTNANTPLTIPTLVSSLQCQGVFHGITRDSIKNFFTHLRLNKPVTGLIIARGDQPQAARDATFCLTGNINLPIYPGETIGIIEAARPHQKGRNIKGEFFSYENIKKTYIAEITLTCKDNCYFDQESGECISEIYGMVKHHADTLSIEPLLKVATDRMSVTGTIYPIDYHGEEPTLTKIRRSILQLRLGMPPSSNAIRQAIEKSLETKEPVELVMVRGKPPKAGSNGFFKEDSSAISPFPLTGQFRNYPKRLYSISSKSKIGAIIFPQKSTVGMDVFGTVVNPTISLYDFIVTNENININFRDNSFYSRNKGVVTLYDNILELSPVESISQFDPVSVDSHIFEYEHSVLFKATKISNSNMRVRNHAFFNGSLIHSRLIAGKDIIARDSITQADIEANTVVAHQILNSTIFSYEDIIFQSRLEDSEVYAENRIIGKAEKSQIQGEGIAAGMLIDVGLVGKANMEPTEIALGYGNSLEEHLLHVAHNLEARIKRYREYLNKLKADYTHGDSPEATHNILNYRVLCLKEIKILQEKIKYLERDYTQYLPRLNARDGFFPNISLNILGCSYKISNNLSAGSFTYAKNYGIKYIPTKHKRH